MPKSESRNARQTMNTRRALLHREPGQRHPRVCFLLGALAVLAAGKLCTGVGAWSVTASPSTTMQFTAGQYEVSTVDELQTTVAQLTSAGGTIHLRAGDYVLDQPLEIRAKSAVQLIGAGWDCRIIRRGDGAVLSLVSTTMTSTLLATSSGRTVDIPGRAVCWTIRRLAATA